MSDNDLKELAKNVLMGIDKLKEAQEKTDIQITQSIKSIKELKEAQEKTDAQLAKTDAQLAKTDEKLKKIGVLTGNISNNQGAVVEEFFYNSLEKTKKLGDLKFDFIATNIKNRNKEIEDEFDIVAYNGDSILLIETKYKFHPEDVKKIKDKKIPNFKKLFPMYKDYKIYGAVAGFNIPKESIKRAKGDKLFVLKRVGEIAKVDFSQVKAY